MKRTTIKTAFIYFIFLPVFIFTTLTSSEAQVSLSHRFKKLTPPKKHKKVTVSDHKEFFTEKIFRFSESQSDFQTFRNSLDKYSIDLENVSLRELNETDFDLLVEYYNRGANRKIWCDGKTHSVWSFKEKYEELIKEYQKENIVTAVIEYQNKTIGMFIGILNPEDRILIPYFYVFDLDINRNQWIKLFLKCLQFIDTKISDKNFEKILFILENDTWKYKVAKALFNCNENGNSSLECSLDNILNLKNFNDLLYEPPFRGPKPQQKLNIKRNNEEYKILKRTKNTTFYKMPDGKTLARIYSAPINYFAEGEWHELKDDAVLFKRENNRLKTIHMNSSFASRSTDNVFFDFKKDTLGFELLEVEMYYDDSDKRVNFTKNNVAGTFDKRYLNFENIFENVDFRYLVDIDRIKNAVIFNEVPFVEDADWEEGAIFIKQKFRLKPGTTVKSDNGIVIFTTSKGEIFQSEIPFIFDQEGRRLDLSYELQNFNNNEYGLSIKINFGWLASEEKVYPLILDPTLTQNSSQDLSLSTGSRHNFAHFKFDISSIPAGSTISSANFTVIITSASLITSATTYAQQFNNQDWTESSLIGTFNNSPDVGGTLDSKTYNTTPDIGSAQTFNVLGTSGDGFLKDHNTNNNNFSVRLRTDVDASTISNYTSLRDVTSTTTPLTWQDKSNSLYVGSRENATASNRPVLEVVYSEAVPAPETNSIFFGLNF